MNNKKIQKKDKDGREKNKKQVGTQRIMKRSKEKEGLKSHLTFKKKNESQK